MEIIPVIDLMQGQVVHARMGQRHLYQPIASQLCPSSKPSDVLEAIFGLYPFSTVYIADLDAIQGKGNHMEDINQIAKAYQSVTFWLDAGIHPLSSTIRYEKNIRFIVGSENVPEMTTYSCLREMLSDQHILSLDAKGNQLLGPALIHCDASYWPEKVIGMQLSQVGSGVGANIQLMAELAARNTERSSPSQLYAAGGVRHIEDCEQLRQIKVVGVLVATALHQGNISRTDLKAFYGQ